VVPGAAGLFQRICLTVGFGWMAILALRLGADRGRADR
jgi:hypothetical protein